MVAFLPPISSCTRKRRAEACRCNCSPTVHEPVKEMALTSGAPTSALPRAAPRPATKFTTPPGTPASASASTMRQALNGAAEAGFNTTVLPQTSAGASFHAGIALGKFHGVISAATPSGRRNAKVWTRSRSEGTSSPASREPSPAK